MLFTGWPKIGRFLRWRPDMVVARQELAAAVRRTLATMIEWHPASAIPPDGTVTVACIGSRSAPAIYRGGEWLTLKGKPLGFEPEYWMGHKNGAA